MKKKFLSLALVLALAISFIPTSFAAENTESSKVNLSAAAKQSLQSFLLYYPEYGYENAEKDLKDWIKDPTKEAMSSGLATMYVYLDFMTNPERVLAISKEIGLDDSESIDIAKCFLNSDVVFKAKAQLIDAFGTKNETIIWQTYMALASPVSGEIKKCWALSVETEIHTLVAQAVAKLCTVDVDAYQWITNSLSGENLQPHATINDAGVLLTWNASSVADGYYVYVQNDDGEMVLAGKTAKNSYQINVLGPAYSVVAFIGYDNQEFTGRAFTATPELQATAIKKLKKGKKKFTVSWKAVPGAQQYAISYTMVKKNKKKQVEKIKYVAAGTTKATIKKLKSNKKYVVKVRPLYSAYNINAISNWTAKKTVKTR